jgi:heme/copper-type cytochrome/quinol oxidase subunit 1
MSELSRGMITVGILVIVISVTYFVIQYYKESKLDDDSNQVETETAEQQQQEPEAKLQAEKDKVDSLVTAIENNTDNKVKVNANSSVESPF